MALLNRYILWYIPESVQNGDLDEFRRGKQYIIFSQIAPLFFIPNIIKWAKIGSSELAISMFCVMIVQAGIPFILRLTKSVAIMGHVGLALLAWHFTFLPFMTGGMFSSALAWTLVLPCFASTFFGMRAFIVWSVIMLIEVIIFIVLEKMGMGMSAIVFTKEQLFSNQMANLIGPLAALTITLYFNNTGLKSALDTQAKAIEENKKTAEEAVMAKQDTDSMSKSIQETFIKVSENTNTLAETSTEIAAMVKNNAVLAGESADLMKTSEKMVADGVIFMNNLSSSMGEITTASHEITKIIKTIDEIAFQTNLLALNAAIEAARAGEVGAGFGVVADEVRSLARRSAEAAKNTATIVESTVKMVSDGEKLSNETSKKLVQIQEQVGKTSILVNEIAAGSKEQAEGVNNIDQALLDLKKIVETDI